VVRATDGREGSWAALEKNAMLTGKKSGHVTSRSLSHLREPARGVVRGARSVLLSPGPMVLLHEGGDVGGVDFLDCDDGQL